MNESVGRKQALRLLLRFTRSSRVLAPNPSWLADRDGQAAKFRVCGVNNDVFLLRGPRRQRESSRPSRRLSAEKNVRLLKQWVGARPRGLMCDPIVGEGSEREWLRQNMLRAEFTGFARRPLGDASAQMTLRFPSEAELSATGTEAMASGVPASLWRWRAALHGRCGALGDGRRRSRWIHPRRASAREGSPAPGTHRRRCARTRRRAALVGSHLHRYLECVRGCGQRGRKRFTRVRGIGGARACSSLVWIEDARPGGPLRARRHLGRVVSVHAGRGARIWRRPVDSRARWHRCHLFDRGAGAAARPR